MNYFPWIIGGATVGYAAKMARNPRNEITICAVYDEETGDLKEVFVEPEGLAGTIWDGTSFWEDSAGVSPEQQAQDEAEAMADEVEAQTGQRPTIREL